MPKIRTSLGYFKYKSHPVFVGIKRIDKKIAEENLSIIKNFLDLHEISFGLIAGTLLGAVREHDFISHDEDIDLFVLEEYKDKLIDLLPKLQDTGFMVARFDRRGLLSIIRKGEYIDLYFFKKIGKGIRHCCGWCIPETYLINTTSFTFKNNVYMVPTEYEQYLRYQYGENWKTPIQYANFELPKWKRKLYEWKECIKEVLPDCIFYSLVKKSETLMFNKYRDRIAKYNSKYKTSLEI